MDTVYFTKMKIALSSVDHLILLIEFCRNAEKPEISHMKRNTYGLLICLQIKLTLLALTSNFFGGRNVFHLHNRIWGLYPDRCPGLPLVSGYRIWCSKV